MQLRMGRNAQRICAEVRKRPRIIKLTSNREIAVCQQRICELRREAGRNIGLRGAGPRPARGGPMHYIIWLSQLRLSVRKMATLPVVASTFYCLIDMFLDRMSASARNGGQAVFAGRMSVGSFCPFGEQTAREKWVGGGGYRARGELITFFPASSASLNKERLAIIH